MNTPDKFDSLGYLNALQEILADPILDEFDSGGAVTQECRSLAHHLAETLGYCRLFNVDVPESFDGSLSAAIATAAARDLREHLVVETLSFDDFPETWEQTQSQVELELLCCDVLETRMDAWAVVVSAAEALMAADDEPFEQVNSLNQAIEQLLDAVDRFDSVLLQNKEQLCIATDTRLLDNWRNLLAEEYRLVLPWWLDGTLERISKAPLERIDLSAIKNPSTMEHYQVELASHATHTLDVRMREVDPALAANDKTQRPQFDEFCWIPSQPEFQCHAFLKVPKTLKASGQTEVHVTFKGPQEQELVGKPMALGKGRAIISSRSLASLPGGSIIQAKFIVEDLALPDGSLPMRVDNKVWQAQIKQNR